MRGIGPRQPLPSIPAAKPVPDAEIIQCQTCDNGYRETARRLSVLSGNLYWTKRREAESLHDHFFISSYPATTRLSWKEHCELCHAAGEACS